LYIGNGGVSMKTDIENASRIVSTYRQQYPEIPDLWRACRRLLNQMIAETKPSEKGNREILWAGGVDSVLAHLPITSDKDKLWLPNNLYIHYPQLRRYYKSSSEKDQTGKDGMVCYDDPYGGTCKLYGAKVVENISQALARIVVTDIAVRVYEMTGYHPWLSTHDSLDYCVPDSEAKDMDAELERQFGIVPSWAEGLPLASEGGWGVTMLDAERGVNE
jgi:hypothetical protein